LGLSEKIIYLIFIIINVAVHVEDPAETGFAGGMPTCQKSSAFAARAGELDHPGSSGGSRRSG
jgi:hypothetical protein